jgi:hypothetical protein|tara:strand:+ start:613 stop:1005 length:393 start_codon:yes stop_codon:yes gene_type:complete
MPSFQTFKDLSLTFKKHPVTNDMVTVKDNAAITQSITALLLTAKGERLFQPELGSDLRSILFQPLDYGAAALIRGKVKDCISRYEPRVFVTDVICYPDMDNDGYSVELYYTIIGRDDRPVAQEFFLERTR